MLSPSESLENKRSLAQIEESTRPRIAWATAAIMIAAVAAAGFLPRLGTFFRIQNSFVIMCTALLAACVATIVWWSARRGNAIWAYYLDHVDTLLFGLVPVLIAFWSAPVGAGIAIAVHALMAVYWGTTLGRSRSFLAVIVLPPLVLIPRLLEEPLLALEAGLAFSVFVITTTITVTSQRRQEDAERERKRREEEARHEQTLAVVSEAVRDAYHSAEAAALAEARLQVHAIKNAFVPMNLYSSLVDLSRIEMDPDTRENLEAVLEGITGMKALLRDGMSGLQPATVASTTTLDEVFHRVRGRLLKISAKALRPTVVGDTSDIVVRGKANVLAECLANLVHNAEEAGARNVIVNVSDEQESVVLRVVDDGHGIPPEVLPRLFQPGATYGKASGTGHALNIARVILETLKGSIDLVRPQPETGAAFEVRLAKPIKEVLDLDAEQTVFKDSPDAPSPVLHKEKLLH